MSFVQPFLEFIRGAKRKQFRTPRRSPRLVVKVAAQLRQSEGQSPNPVTLTNISVGGASMVGRVRLRNGERVLIALQLNSGLKFDLSARVVHARHKPQGEQHQYGLRFFGLSQADHQRLAEYIHDPKNGWQFDAPPPPWDPDAA